MNVYTESTDRIYHRTSSDLSNKAIANPIWISQGNKYTSVIAVTLYNNNSKISDDILANSSANLKIRLNNYNYTRESIGYNNSTVYFVVNSTMSGYAGLYDAQVELTTRYPGMNNGIVSSFPVKMNIISNLTTNDILPTSVVDFFNGTCEHVQLDTAKKINKYLFYNYSSLIDFKIKYCPLVETYAFNSCENLKTVDLGYNIEKIGTYAFSNNPKIESIFIRNTDKVVDVSEDPFYTNHPMTNHLVVYVPSLMYEAYLADEEWQFLLNEPGLDPAYRYNLSIEPIPEEE